TTTWTGRAESGLGDQGEEVLRVGRLGDEVEVAKELRGVLRDVLQHEPQRRPVLQGEPDRVPDHQLVRAAAARRGTGDDLPQLRHREVRRLTLDLALDAGLLGQLDEHARARDDRRVELRLARAVTADRVDEYPAGHVGVVQHRGVLLVRGARRDDVGPARGVGRVVGEDDVEAERL